MNKVSNRTAFTIIGIVLVIFFAVIVSVEMSYKKNINKMKSYAEKFVEENFSDDDYKIEYSDSGKCIISGDCAIDFAMGIDGGVCDEYHYAENCKSYYFNVINGKETTIVTVFDKNGSIGVVKGKNINGEE